MDGMLPEKSAATDQIASNIDHSSKDIVDTMIAQYGEPIGLVKQASGTVTVTHQDGSTTELKVGSPIFSEDDIVTSKNGAVEVHFADQSKFSLGPDSQMLIDKYVYDPAKITGEQQFSILKGVFVFVSGLVADEAPENVAIKTPAGTLGIRGTVVAGSVDSNGFVKLTLVEGAAFLRDGSGKETDMSGRLFTVQVEQGGNVETSTLTLDQAKSLFGSMSGVAGETLKITIPEIDWKTIIAPGNQPGNQPGDEPNNQQENQQENQNPQNQGGNVPNNGVATSLFAALNNNSSYEQNSTNQQNNNGSLLNNPSNDQSDSNVNGGLLQVLAGGIDADNAAPQTENNNPLLSILLNSGEQKPPSDPFDGIKPPPLVEGKEPDPILEPVLGGGDGLIELPVNTPPDLPPDLPPIIDLVTVNSSGGGGSTLQSEIFGTSETEILYGNSLSNVIFAKAGADIVYGISGADTVFGNQDNDTLYGQDGNDLIVDDGVDTGLGGNILAGAGSYDDVIFGGAGDDRVYVTGGSDLIYGDAGQDYINGKLSSGAMVVFGGDDDDRLLGGGGSDNLNGGASDDILAGRGGNDTLDGGSGSDTLSAGNGNNLLNGGDGSDRLIGGSGSDTLNGGLGDDVIYGVNGSDTLIGDVGNDTLYGGSGIDYIDGGAGNNIFYLESQIGNNTIIGGAGSDTIFANYAGINGNILNNIDSSDKIVILGRSDIIDEGKIDLNISPFVNSTSITVNDGNTPSVFSINGTILDYTLTDNNGDLVISFNLANSLRGDSGNNVLAGLSTSSNIFFGNDGNDSMTGGSANDVFNGGPGNDTVFGNDGRDTITGDVGNDALYGGSGNDEIAGDEGNDTIYGDDGADSLSGGLGDDVLYGGDGSNLLIGDIGNDTLYGGNGFDTLFGGSGDDLLIDKIGGAIVTGGDGDDVFASGEFATSAMTITDFRVGFDKLYFQTSGSTAVTTIDNANGTSTIAVGGIDAFIVEGKVTLCNAFLDGNLVEICTDPITPSGTTGDEVLYGASGNDNIIALAGDDTVYAGLGDDTVFGAAGQDLIVGGSGNDTVYGGGGSDVIYGGDGHDRVFAADSAGSTDIGNNTIYGGDGADTLYGSDQGDYLDLGTGNNELVYGCAGNDTIYGSFGSDAVYSGTGNDQVNARSGNDTIIIDDGNDTVYAGKGSDNIDGISGTGNTLIYGNQGNDTITGGTGNDTIYGGVGNDTIDGCDGDDKLFAGSGRDSLTGGVGADFFIGSVHQLQNDTISDFDSGYGDRLVVTGVNYTDQDVRIDFTSNTMTVDEDNDGIIDLTIDIGSASYNYASVTYSGGASILTLETISVVNGGGTSGDDTINGSVADDTLFGDAGADILFGGGGNDSLAGGIGDDQVHGGGGDDTLIGGVSGSGVDNLFGDNGNDHFVIGSPASIGSIDGGAGFDSLVMTSGLALNFAPGGNVEYTIINNIEEITGAGTGMTVTLDLNAVFDLTDSNNTLTINLDAGNTVNLLDGFVDTGTDQTVDGDVYNIYEGSSGSGLATLLINNNLAVNASGLP